MNNHGIDSPYDLPIKDPEIGETRQKRRIYHTPFLKEFGNLHSKTLGGSPGFGEIDTYGHVTKTG